jgi:hypothetical protein
VTLCEIDSGTLRCRVCGARVTATHVLRTCRPGLGDMIATGLSVVGVTKERVSRILGRPCDCEGRRLTVNQWGAKYLGIGRVDSPT